MPPLIGPWVPDRPPQLWVPWDSNTQFAAVPAGLNGGIDGGPGPKLGGMHNRTAGSAASPRSRSLEPALQHIRAHLGEPLRLEALAALCDLSVWRFATVFRERIGVSPGRYVNTLRIQRAQALLSQGVPAARAASEVGFYDQSHLNRRFKRQCGMTPREFQQSRAATC